MRMSYSDRDKYLADADFAHIPVHAVTNARLFANAVGRHRSGRSHRSGGDRPGSPGGPGEGQHNALQHRDSKGNAVAVTYTLNAGYGSGVAVPHAGFLLNNEMDDFTTKTNIPNQFQVVQSTNNFIAPGKRPLSSMAPTIVLTNERPFLVLGAPGGTRIPSAVLQVILNVVDFHMDLQEAVDFPRIHAQATNALIDIERGVSPDTVRLLTHPANGMGYIRNPKAPLVIAGSRRFWLATAI